MAQLTIKEFFRNLNKDTMHLVDEFYDKNAHFRDPLTEHQSAAGIKAYYANLYQHVKSITFDISDEVVQGATHVAVWKMTLECGLNGGKPYSVDGISYIQFGGGEGKAVYHRDYFDVGDFVYERVPVVKNIVQFVKRKMVQND